MAASCPSVSVRPLSRAQRSVQCKQVKAVALTIRAHLVELSCLHHCLDVCSVPADFTGQSNGLCHVVQTIEPQAR